MKIETYYAQRWKIGVAVALISLAVFVLKNTLSAQIGTSTPNAEDVQMSQRVISERLAPHLSVSPTLECGERASSRSDFVAQTKRSSRQPTRKTPRVQRQRQQFRPTYEIFPTSTRDGFDYLNTKWKWIDPGEDCDYSLTKKRGHLVITAPEGKNDLFVGSYDAPRMVQSINGDFTIETKMTTKPDQHCEGAGLLVWQGEGDLVRFERAFNQMGSMKGNLLRLDKEEGGLYQTVASKKLNWGTVYLRLKCTAGSLSATYSKDGIEWKEFAATQIELLEKADVGMYVTKPTDGGTPQEAHFDYFKLISKPIVSRAGDFDDSLYNFQGKVFIYHDARHATLWVSQEDARKLAEELKTQLAAKRIPARIGDAVQLRIYMTSNPKGIIVMTMGVAPDIVFRGEKDSFIEQWMDRGGKIVWTAGWEFRRYSTMYRRMYRVRPSADRGAKNVFDLIQKITNQKTEGHTMSPTALGKKYIPSLDALQSLRPAIISALDANRMKYEIYATDGVVVDPVMFQPRACLGVFVKFRMEENPKIKILSRQIADFIANRFIFKPM